MIIKGLTISNAEEAKSVLQLMKTIVKYNRYVSVARYYEIIGRPEFAGMEETLYGWDWEKLDGVEVGYVIFGYRECILSLPEPESTSVIMDRLLSKATLNDIFGYNEVTKHTNEQKEQDMVSHPPHYQSKSGLEVIDVIEAFTEELNGVEATDTGNIIKYACRWKDKNGVEDLKKAVWYANHLIEYLERKGE